jgi:hypothetical protein
MLSLTARLTGYVPRWLTYFIGDAHIYENQLDMLHEQLRREPLPAPRLVLSDRIPALADTGQYEPEWLDRVEPERLHARRLPPSSTADCADGRLKRIVAAARRRMTLAADQGGGKAG